MKWQKGIPNTAENLLLCCEVFGNYVYYTGFFNHYDNCWYDGFNKIKYKVCCWCRIEQPDIEWMYERIGNNGMD